VDLIWLSTSAPFTYENFECGYLGLKGLETLRFIPARDGSPLLSGLAAARIYMRLGQRTIQPVIPQLAAAGVDLLASECTDEAGFGEVSGTGDSGQQ
jgi:hypothetical protein